jgi:SAM-dependent methyltransferase
MISPVTRPEGGPAGPVHPAALSFGAVAAEYDRARPDYPPEAVDHLVRVVDLRPGRRVADIGAGTGKLTRLLVPTGAEVHAIEPVDGMRDELVRTTAGVTVHAATAEALPFEPASLDGATAAQAVHWFGPAWVDELVRTLRPGAAIAIVYNVRDRTQPVQAAISAARERVADGAPSYVSGRWREPLEACAGLVDRGADRFPWTYERSHAEVLDQVCSLAPISALDPPHRARLLAGIAEVLESEPDPVALRNATEVTLWRRA